MRLNDKNGYRIIFVALYLLLACGCGSGGGSGSDTSTVEPSSFSADKTDVLFFDQSQVLVSNELLPSWSVAWGYLNSDDLPDIWVGNHGNQPALLENRLNQQFTDIAALNLDGYDTRAPDSHGVASADWDNDGQDEFLIQVGAAMGSGADANRFFNRLVDGRFTDVAPQNGLDLPELRGRTPLPVDLNGDGLLDVILTNAFSDQSPGIVPMCQEPDGRFLACMAGTFPAASASDFAILGDFSGDDKPDVLTFPDAKLGDVVNLDTGTRFALDIRDRQGVQVPIIRNIRDAFVGDVNGDGLNDLLLVRDTLADGIEVVDENRYGFFLYVMANQKEIVLPTVGDLTFDLCGFDSLWSPDDIFIGTSGRHPECFNPSGGLMECIATLVSSDPDNWGLVAASEASDASISIGYDTATSEWLVRVSSDNVFRSLSGFLDISARVSAEIRTVGFWSPSIASYLLMNKGAYFEAAPIEDLSGNSPLNCRSAVMADMNNDGDLDLYFVCNTPVNNQPNQLYWNDGQGGFLLSEDPVLDERQDGRGDTVTTADYDLDGDLDLFITNGYGSAPFNMGTSQLLRNLGNDNHWLEVNLVGTTSNRDGIGAVVLVTTQNWQQRREANAGIHARAQNMRTLHFGLGRYDKIDRLDVIWPGGKRSVLEDVPVDQILSVIEP